MNTTVSYRFILVSLLSFAGLTAQAVEAPLPSFADFQAKAARANLVLALPDYPKTPDEIRARTNATIKEADAALAALVAQDSAKATFASTLVAYDGITSRAGTFAGQIGTLAETHPDKAMRDAARDASSAP